MITYLIGIVATFFLFIFLARKFNKKFDIYRDSNEEKRMTIVVIVLFSVFWPFTILFGIVFGFFTFVVLSSTKLLK